LGCCRPTAQHSVTGGLDCAVAQALTEALLRGERLQ